MTNLLKDVINAQSGKAGEVLKALTNNLDFTEKDTLNLFMETQESLLDSYALTLEKQEQELTEQLFKTVIEMTAKISMVRSLLLEIGKQESRRQMIRENTLIEETGDN